MFRRIFATALIAGAAAGLLAFALQRVELIPLIARAEVYEATTTVGHREIATPSAWMLPPGLERAGYTIIADLLVGVGFALLLTAAVALAENAGHSVSAWRGALWGAAGFGIFVL